MMERQPTQEEIEHGQDENAASEIWHTIGKLKDYKPNDRSARDRAYAVTITELEKAFAYFVIFAQYRQGESEQH